MEEMESRLQSPAEAFTGLSIACVPGRCNAGVNREAIPSHRPQRKPGNIPGAPVQCG